MLSLIPLLLSIVIVLINPILMIPLVVIFLAFRYFKNRSHNHNRKEENTIKNNACKLIYPKINVKNFDEKTFSINLKISVTKCVATYSIGLGRYILLGAIIFRKIKNESLLKEIIINLPVDYSFTVIRRINGSGDVYLLCLRVKSSFQNYDNKVSMIIGILNSLATTIPADEVKILEGRNLLSSILNVNLDERLWR